MLLISALLLISIDVFSKKKERKIKNLKLINKLEEVSKKDKLKFIQDKKNSKNYLRVQSLLIKAGINRPPELIKLFSIIIPVLVFLLLVVVKYTDIINSRLNIDQLREVSKFLGNEEIANIDKSIDFKTLFMYSMPFYFSPIVFLKLLSSFRGMKSQNEVIMLQTYTIILLKTEQSVKQILIVLLNRANIFKPYLEKAVNSYSQDPVKSLKTLKENTPNKNFGKIVMALEQALRLDRNTSTQYLETHRNLGKELNRINKKNRDAKKQIIGLLMMLFPLIIFFTVGGYPWLLFSLKSLGEIPM